MKKYLYKSLNISVAIFLLIFSVTSCETTDLDINNDPNSLTLESSDPNFVLNSLQFGITQQHLTLSINSAGIVRHTNLFGTYANSAGAGTLNGPWSNTYFITTNLNLLETLSETQNLPNHVGIGQVIEAFAYVNLVDYIGTAVYSEAVNPEFPQPNLDAGESIYDAMYAQLDEAIVNLQATSAISPEDLYFNGDLSKWIKLANTLKLKMYVQSKLSGNASAVSDINAIITSGNYINSLEDDFETKFGTNLTNPDTRHPLFVGDYSSAANTYMSNDFMNLLRFGKTVEDPRLKYYIYRQDLNDPADDLLPCDGSADYDYCYIGDGYWGRDHGDDEGIPNDGSNRSTYGIYPVGGAFDDAPSQADVVAQAVADYVANPDQTQAEFISMRLNTENPTTSTSTNLGGAGIHPMLLASFSQFMLAEAALPAPAGLGVTGSSRTYLMDAIQSSFDKVGDFSGILMDAAATTAYKTVVGIEYDATTTDEEKLAIIIREYYIASYGNSVEAYNSYRRTGYPTLQSAVISTTEFPRSYFIPSSELNSNDNPNLVQKSLTDQVFWDTNPAGFIQ
jgi:hypothetical protein